MLTCCASIGSNGRSNGRRSGSRSWSGSSKHSVAGASLFLATTLILATGSATAGSSLLADLPPEGAEAVARRIESGELSTAERSALLAEIYALAGTYRFQTPWLTVKTDRRWFRSQPASAPGAPLLEARRWPGDSVLAFYIVAGGEPTEGYRPPLQGAVFETPKVSQGEWIWSGRLEDKEGAREVEWRERRVGGGASGRRLAALLVPGDAGLGLEAMDDLLFELRFAWAVTELHVDAWKETTPAITDLPLQAPRLSLAAHGWDEARDVWQIARTTVFTLGLPPGVISVRLGEDFQGPLAIDNGLLWLRGRYQDLAGKPVAIGDGRRAGYVAYVAEEVARWRGGEVGPRGCEGGKRVVAAPFPLAVTRTGARAAVAERWKEPGFDGAWFVFRLDFEAYGIEIGLPVVQGLESESLYWIPVSYRPVDQPPAPPPVDPAERFGIRFDRFGRAEREHNPWVEGYLKVPGLRLEVPAGWWPVARLRSRNGFPVRFANRSDGQNRAWLRRLEADDPIWEAVIGGGWQTVERPKRFRARRVHTRPADDARVYRDADGHGFLLEKAEGASVEPHVWTRFVESALLIRVKREAESSSADE